MLLKIASSVAPLGLVIVRDVEPTADAVGYRLSVLRTWEAAGARPFLNRSMPLSRLVGSRDPSGRGSHSSAVSMPLDVGE